MPYPLPFASANGFRNFAATLFIALSFAVRFSERIEMIDKIFKIAYSNETSMFFFNQKLHKKI
jgi:hypothetical protein